MCGTTGRPVRRRARVRALAGGIHDLGTGRVTPVLG